MGFGHFDDKKAQPMSEINIIPLVDIMLVLLILFIVTAPLLTPYVIKIDVPEAETETTIDNDIKSITLSIDEKGQFFWNDEKIDKANLDSQLKKIAQQQPQPELHLRADSMTVYRTLAEVMAMAQNAGVEKLGFITNPEQL